MRIKLGELRTLIESQVREEAFEKHHIHLHEANGEGSKCKKRLKAGDRFEPIEAVRIIPDPRRPGHYFGGDAWGSRARGTTAMTINPGTPLLCYETDGSYGWFAIPTDRGNILKVRIHINKFCSVTREEEARKTLTKKETQKKNKGDIPDDVLANLMAGISAPKKAAPAAATRPLTRDEKIAQLRAELAQLEQEETVPEPELDNEFDSEDQEEAPNDEDIDALFGLT